MVGKKYDRQLSACKWIMDDYIFSERYAPLLLLASPQILRLGALYPENPFQSAVKPSVLQGGCTRCLRGTSTSVLANDQQVPKDPESLDPAD